MTAKNRINPWKNEINEIINFYRDNMKSVGKKDKPEFKAYFAVSFLDATMNDEEYSAYQKLKKLVVDVKGDWSQYKISVPADMPEKTARKALQLIKMERAASDFYITYEGQPGKKIFSPRKIKPENGI